MSKSNSPKDVPAKIKVQLGNLGPILAQAASENRISLSEEIRRRLTESLTEEEKKKLE